MPTRVQFDIGLEDNLPTLGMAENGHLYLSKDNGNMYLGLPNGSLLPLNRSPYFGKCTTAASTNSKVVSLDVEDSNFYLKSGVMISVMFNNENSASSPTLNVNNTGAIAIKSFGTTAIGNTPNTSWHSGEVISFIYDGNYWMKVGFDISEKADKVSNATNGNFAGLDSTGNLTDSGHNSSELVPSGGTIGQILAKHSNTDNDVEWITPEDTEISVSITYNNLVTLKTGGNLVPGMQYRITDYTCTTTQANTQSAGHLFDIIVTADSETELNESARAALYSGDTYFQNCNLDAWEIKYCLENYTDRFAWADSTNGKGVIYYMKDEFDNECPYDFKNIMFTDNGTNYYTFNVLIDSVHYDFSVAQTSKNCYGNIIEESYTNNSVSKLTLRKNIFKNTSLSSTCYSNILENNCYNNIFGNNCYVNTFGNSCNNNTFGNNCHNNTFGDGFQSNSFGNYFYHNTFGNNCYSNTFGNYYQNITVFDGVQYCSITGGTTSEYVQNAQVLSGTHGTSSNSKLTISFSKKKNYTQIAGLVNGTDLRIWIAEDTVTGPTSSADGNIAIFDGTSGKIVKDSGLQISDLADMVETTWSGLKTLKSGGNLVPGKQYRITDYNTTISEDLTDVSVAEHQFDIIVTALSETELDHRASAIQHEGDTYFSDCDLSKWQLWYDIENDTEKYEWALDDSSSSNGGAKGSIPEYAPEYIFSDDISAILSNAGLSRVLVFQGIETISIKGTDTDCYVYGTSVQVETIGEYEKIFLQEYPSVSSTIYGIDSKGGIHTISTVTSISISTQPTNGTKIIAKSVTSGATASLLNKAGISPELEFNGQIVMYKGQNCYSYGSSAQYTALAKEYKNISCIIVEDGISPIAPKKIEEPGTNVIILDGEYEIPDPIGTVSQETVVVGGNSGGTGVIYRMIDEWGNDCPYDFKNIMFTNNSTNYYTFNVLIDSVHYDFSVAQTSKNCHDNTIKSSINKFGELYKYYLSKNIFKNTDLTSSSCYSNTIENNCYDNTFGDNCSGNSLGNNCYGNTFGNICYRNSFGDSCYSNSFGNNCQNNIFGNYCQNNTVGNNFQYNSLENGCNNNSFGNYCQNNSFGNKLVSNSFGNYCQSIIVFDGVQFCNVTGGTGSLLIKNAQILNGTQGTSSSNRLTISFEPNKNYTQVAGLVNGTDLRIWIAEDEVTGPTTATDSHIALFDGTTGKIIKDSGVAISDLSPDLVTPITYNELVTLKNGGNLVPGMQYRITDYECTTTALNTRAVNHKFDIIVTADSVSSLNEVARVAKNSSDTYFDNCNLEAWELKYCLENETSRFSWADDTDGNGVVYYMKDEWGNEAPYDFKNIQFKRWAVTSVTSNTMTQEALESLNTDFCFDGDETMFQARFGYKGSNCSYGQTLHVVNSNNTGWYYTFSIILHDVESGEYSLNDIEDGSIKGNNYYNDEGGGGFYGNTIKPIYNNAASDEDGIDSAQVLNNIVLNGYYENSDENPYIYGCYNNIFGGNCCDSTFGVHCCNNSFGNNFHNNSFGYYFYGNSFGNDCSRNLFGHSCYRNLFGNGFYSNSFGVGCTHNTFGNDCGQNSFGNNCIGLRFGDCCDHIILSNAYIKNLIVENGNRYITLTVASGLTPTNSLPLRNITIAQGVNNTTTYKTITHNSIGDTFRTVYQPINSQVISV